MDRSLKVRTFLLAAGVVFCIGVLMPTFAPGFKDSLPSWAANLFGKPINLGLDLQGGKHIVYNIALDKAVDDKASEIKRDLEAGFIDDKIDAVVKTPATPLGAVTVLLSDKDKGQKAEITAK